MRLSFRFVVLLILLFPLRGAAQQKPSAKTPRILILLDGSSSMAEEWTRGRTRFQQAGRFILSLIDSMAEANSEVEFGLRVFGHQYPSQERNCYDTKMEIKFSRQNIAQMEARLSAMHGYGVSPIAYSLSEAANEDFEDEYKYAYSIILVTDGGESCDGNICKVVNDLLQRKIFFKPYIVSLVDYAPLKDQYSCLGSFLTVSTEGQMPPSIHTIVEAHREGFERAKTGKVIRVMPEPKRPDTIVIPITIKPEPKKPEPVKGDTIVIPIKIKEQPKKPEPVKGDTIVIPIRIKEEPKNQAPLPVRDRKVVRPLKLNTRLRVYKTIVIDPPFPRFVEVPEFRLSEVGNPPKVTPPPAPRPKAKKVSPVSFSNRRLIRNKLAVLPAPQAAAVPAIQLTKFEREIKPETTAAVKPSAPAETKPVVKPVVKPAEKPIVKRTETNYVVEKTPAEETTVEIFFTDGNGKFYATTPQILLSDPVSNKAIRQFYRTVDPNGNPDPIKINEGAYNLSVVGSDKTFLKEIQIAAKMKNKIVITVSNGSLQFVWKGGNQRKPVDKYMAQVKRNFVPQPMVKQRCDTVLPYPPGNYHIEINTLPVTVRSVDLGFGATVIIPIDEPGVAQISNTQSMGKAVFYHMLGDRFVQFYTMNVTGNPADQMVELMPGLYEVHFNVAAGMPERVFAFHVYSNGTTHIELK